MAPLPKVGDIITFSGKWNLTLAEPEPSPSGIVIRIEAYSTLSTFGTYVELHGTLAYPLSIDHESSLKSKVFIVEWATHDLHVKQSYRHINEEWFYNGVFLTVSEA
jgi:hypothetical protein